jgi:hypothetical protein
MSNQTPDRHNAADRKPVPNWTRLWLVLLGVARVAWLAGLALAAAWLIQLHAPMIMLNAGGVKPLGIVLERTRIS